MNSIDERWLQKLLLSAVTPADVTPRIRHAIKQVAAKVQKIYYSAKENRVDLGV